MARNPENRLSQPPKRNGFLVLWTSAGVLFLLIFALPTVVLLVCGMLPALVAFIIDRQPERSATFCVASVNFCGVFPFMLDMWINEHSLVAAVQTLTSPFALFIMFGAAALGWVVFTTVPPFISSFMAVIAQHRVVALRSDQKKLIAEWGKEVGDRVEAGNPINTHMENRNIAGKPENRNAAARTRTAAPSPDSADDAADASRPEEKSAEPA